MTETSYEPIHDSGYVEIGNGVSIFRRYFIHVVEGGIRVSIGVETLDDGRPWCANTSLAVYTADFKGWDSEEPGAKSGVTTRILQGIDIDALVERSRRSPLLITTTPGHHDLNRPQPDRHGLRRRKPTKGKPLSDDHLRAVAATHAEGGAVGRGPISYVADVAGVSRATAGRWVKTAIERGFIEGPAAK